MALGNARQNARIYLSVGFGKIRQKSLSNGEKVSSTTPDAVKRTTQGGADSWAIEYDFIKGVIENIFYKEDEKYGNAYEVIVSDVADEYQLSFKEDSRFWNDFIKKLPNVNLKEQVNIMPYDFESKGHRYVGLAIVQGEVKLKSFYEEKVNDTWKYLNNYPEPVGVDWKDKDDVKIYMLKVKKYLRKEFNERIKPMFDHKPIPKEFDDVPENKVEIPVDDDDLPF